MSRDVLAYTRPYPPEHMRSEGLGFERAEDVEQLIRCDFTGRGGLFFDPEHGHLTQARIGVLWAAGRHVDKGSQKAGTAEMLRQPQRKWSSQQRHVLLHFFFGDILPNFLITLFAPGVFHRSDRWFFGLVDHELSHCAVAKDEWGVPRFNEDTGLPVWANRPHDVETFVGTTERWGATDTGAAALVQAGMKQPRYHWVPGEPFSPNACGTCGR
jgi:hypothetical protein